METKIETGNFRKIILTGLFSGLIVGILPGVGESQAGVLVSQFTNLSNNEFLGALASINVSSLFFSIVSLYSLGRIRSGVGAAVSEILNSFNYNFLIVSVGVFLFSGAISVLLTWFIGKRLLLSLQKINYKFITTAIISFIVFSVFLLTGFIGLFVLVISTVFGILAILFDVKRTCNMGYLMLPTIIYFSGLVHFINALLY